MDPRDTPLMPNGEEPDPQVRRMRYQEAFEFAPDCQLITDGTGLILEANHAAATLVGHRKEFLISKPLAFFAEPGSRSRFYACLGNLTRGNPTTGFEARMTRRGEDPREVHVVVRTGERASDPTCPATIHWLIRDVTEWHRANAARTELQQRLITAREDEQRRIARDLHDTVGQTIAALALGVRAAKDSSDSPELTRFRLDHVQRLVDDLAKQVHELAVRLRPTALDDLGLEAAARQLVADWARRTGVTADFQAAGLNERFSPEVEAALYRVVQEALTNVAKHAGAWRVAVVLGHSGGHAVAVIEDDGIGFDVEAVSQSPTPGRVPAERGHLGLAGMRERLSLVGGRLEIETSPGRGTTIIARVPLNGTKPQDPLSS